MRAWVDGRVLGSPEEPAISVLDHGLVVGDGVFETIAVDSGVPFALTRHLERLAGSAAGLGIGRPDLGLLREGVAATMDGQDLPFGRIRITVTSGRGPLGSPRGDHGLTHVVVTEPAERPPSVASIATVPWPRNERGATAGLKTTSYAENVIALAHAQSHGADEALLANTAGDLCEGTGSNVFYVLDGELRTPTLASGCLAGVTRALVLQWCGGREVDAPLLEVRDAASEVFLVSTTRDVQPVLRWDGRTWQAPGPITLQAARTWARREPEGY